MQDKPNFISPLIRLNPADNVAVARERIDPAEMPEVDGIRPLAKIPRGHKMATAAIARGEPVTKYGQTIGFASDDIAAGAHVHSHNLAVGEFTRDYAVGVDAVAPDMIPEAERATFMGYARPDGRFMLTFGNGVTPDTPLDSLEAIYDESFLQAEAAVRRFC